jgi:tetratricopeptide (TPR) repeat protein
MSLKTVRIALAIVFALGVTAPSRAAEGTAVGADQVRDEAIAKTAAWRPKSAETILNKSLDYQESQPWLTAEALLMATFGIGQDEETVTKALAILDKQSKKDPGDPVAEFYRGEVLKWVGESDKAMTAWQNARDRAKAQVANDARDARAQFYLGASLVRLKNPGDARKALKKAEKLGFDQPMVDFQIGLAYLLGEDWKAAVTSFDDVFEVDPRYAHLYFYRGLAWDKLGEKARFINDLDQFVKLAPNSPEAKTARAILASAK